MKMSWRALEFGGDAKNVTQISVWLARGGRRMCALLGISLRKKICKGRINMKKDTAIVVKALSMENITHVNVSLIYVSNVENDYALFLLFFIAFFIPF